VNKSNSKLNLYLGCNGNADRNGFTLCMSCENNILDIYSLNDIIRDKVILFLERTANLSAGPVENNSKAFNIINLLNKDYNLFSESKIINIQKFFQIHKECGIYLTVIQE